MDENDATSESPSPETPSLPPTIHRESSDAGVSKEANSPVESISTNPDPIPDTRLYVPDHEDWDVHIKRDSDRYFCYSKHPGEDWFHLLLNGEIYVSRQHEKYCLRCALRMGFLTEDRLFWQHRVPKKRKRVL